MAQTTRRSREARSSPPGPRAGSVFHSGAIRAGLDLLAPEERTDSPADGRLFAGRAGATKLQFCLHAAYCQARTLAHQRSRTELCGFHVRAYDARRNRVSFEADELSVSHRDL